MIGVLLAGRLTESRGRRPVAVIGLLVATAFQMLFFVASDDAVLWVAPTIAIVAAACAGLALGTLDAELFPTETRGTSNGFLLVAGVAGSAVGLVVATQLRDAMGGLGPAIAMLRDTDAHRGGPARAPTARDRVTRSLDDVSPTDVERRRQLTPAQFVRVVGRERRDRLAVLGTVLRQERGRPSRGCSSRR